MAARRRNEGGRPLRRTNRRLDLDDIWNREQPEIRLERWSPGPESRHLVTIRQLRDVIALLPDWDTVTTRLDAIVLDGGHATRLGWCSPGIVAICAWDRRMWWTDADPWFLGEHAHLLDALGVEVVKHGPRQEIRWTEAQARAFQLLHILPHELGHHHDRITNRSRTRAARGEPYAEAYANRVFDEILPAYREQFGW